MLILLAAAALTATDPAPALAPPRCTPAADKTVGRGPVGVRKLADMPPGQQIKAVWRLDEKGCSTPVVVRSDVGVNGR